MEETQSDSLGLLKTGSLEEDLLPISDTEGKPQVTSSALHICFFFRQISPLGSPHSQPSLGKSKEKPILGTLNCPFAHC